MTAAIIFECRGLHCVREYPSPPHQPFSRKIPDSARYGLIGTMKILHTVELYPPSVGGMQEVVRQLSERLVKLGHDVTVATTFLPERSERLINGVKVVDFKIAGNMIRGITGEVAAYQNFLRSSDFDIIANFNSQQWATDCMLPLLGEIKAKKVFVPTGFSYLYDERYKSYFAQMGDWMKQYDMNVFLSNDYWDVNFARQHAILHRVLIPNGAAAEEFLEPSPIDVRAQLSIPCDYRLILHVGTHTGLKGHSNTIRIFAAARIRKAALIIVGNEWPGGGCMKKCRMKKRLFDLSPRRLLDRKKLLLARLGRPETVAAFQQADLFLFPSLAECSPLVLFECLASKTPFLTSSAGNAAEIIEWSNAGFLLPTYVNRRGRNKIDIQESARLLERMLGDDEGLERMKENGFKVWKQNFTWDKIARDYEQMYGELLRRP
jgi:glycosyltransferase involved in cell wall biosynthesis